MKLDIREIALFSMLGGLMYAGKAAMAALPNIHPVALFIVVFTVVYRKKALYPIHLYILLEGIFGGFTAWWIPYLYIWDILFLAVYFLPVRMPDRVAVPVYALVSGLFGLLYGTLFAPAQALLFGLNLKGMIAWIMAGFPFDLLHGIGNFTLGLLAVPLIRLFRKLERLTGKNE